MIGINFAAADAESFAAMLQAGVEQAMVACAESANDQEDGDAALYAAGAAQLIDVLRRVEADTRSTGAVPLQPAEIGELGGYGFGLLQGLEDCLREAGSAELAGDLALLNVPLALWVARHGGVLEELGPLTDILAQLANMVEEPAQLRTLAATMGELADAAAPAVRGDLERLDPGRPWRILHLNRAIVATRSGDAESMEAAYEALARRLPEDGAEFFQEAGRRVERLGTPEAVRGVLRRFQARFRPLGPQ